MLGHHALMCQERIWAAARRLESSGDARVLTLAAVGLTIGQPGSQVRGLDIEHFASRGVTITAGGNAQIAGCFIGTDPTGEAAAPNATGLVIENSSNLIGGPIITCSARDKHKHMHPGDVLVDDREKHRATYEAAGVVFVHHANAKDSLRQLVKFFPSVRTAA